MKKKESCDYSLESFVKETQANIIEFAEEYRKKHVENPEHYPLELSKDNSGLWLEFFIEFCTSRTI